MKRIKALSVIVSMMLLISMFSSCDSLKKTSETTKTTSDSTQQSATDGSDEVELVNQTSDEDVPTIDGYDLLWHDEFNGTTLNTDIWTREVRPAGWTNSELQQYCDSEDNVYVEDGNLVLRAYRYLNENGFLSYSSGKVNSQNKADFMYGKVVVRAKVPEGKGFWPAIWMMPTNESVYGNWPRCGEIDIMEVLGSETDLSYSTIHYGLPHAEQQGTFSPEDGSSFADDYHIFSVEWEPGEMRFYTDDVLVLTVNDWYSATEGSEDVPYPAPFNQTFFVQMNLAVGGTWPGNPDASTSFDDAEFDIDYVRVYQKPSYDTNVTKPVPDYREPLEDGNYIYNGDFATDEDLTDEENWNFLLFEGGEGEAAISDNMINISTENQGTVDYSVQLVQRDLPILNGHTYRVTFDASADENRSMKVCVSAPNAGWIRYLADTTVELTPTTQTYTYEFTSSDRDDAFGRLEFNMGNTNSTSTIHISNVRVEEVS